MLTKEILPYIKSDSRLIHLLGMASQSICRFVNCKNMFSTHIFFCGHMPNLVQTAVKK